MKATNRQLSFSVSPGTNKLTPVSVFRPQLLCLPLPLMPANGFSWKRMARPWSKAKSRSTSIASMLVSAARFARLQIGEISCCAGATSLWVQWIEIPSSHIFSRASAM